MHPYFTYICHTYMYHTNCFLRTSITHSFFYIHLTHTLSSTYMSHTPSSLPKCTCHTRPFLHLPHTLSNSSDPSSQSPSPSHTKLRGIQRGLLPPHICWSASHPECLINNHQIFTVTNNTTLIVTFIQRGNCRHLYHGRNQLLHKSEV